MDLKEWIDFLFHEDEDHFSLDEEESIRIRAKIEKYLDELEHIEKSEEVKSWYYQLLSDCSIPQEVKTIFVRDLIVRLKDDAYKSILLELFTSSKNLPPMAYLMNDVFRNCFDVEQSKVVYPQTLNTLMKQLNSSIQSVNMTYIKKLFINSNLCNVIIRELRKSNFDDRDNLIHTALCILKDMGPLLDNSEILQECLDKEKSDSIKSKAQECLELIDDLEY